MGRTKTTWAMKPTYYEENLVSKPFLTARDSTGPELCRTGEVHLFDDGGGVRNFRRGVQGGLKLPRGLSCPP